VFSSSKCSLFHNSIVFGSCIIHILYTGCAKTKKKNNSVSKRLNAELNPICHLLALLGAHHIFHVSRIGVKTQRYGFRKEVKGKVTLEEATKAQKGSRGIAPLFL